MAGHEPVLRERLPEGIRFTFFTFAVTGYQVSKLDPRCRQMQR
jgi:hypothetical protein